MSVMTQVHLNHIRYTTMYASQALQPPNVHVVSSTTRHRQGAYRQIIQSHHHQKHERWLRYRTKII